MQNMVIVNSLREALLSQLENDLTDINMMNNNNQTALMIAVDELMRCLSNDEIFLSLRGAADIRTNNLLQLHNIDRYVKIIQALLEYGADFDIRDNIGNQRLFFLPGRTVKDVIQVLVKVIQVESSVIKTATSLSPDSEPKQHSCQFVLNAKDVDGQTCLLVASATCQIQLIKELIGLGANTDIYDYNGRSSLHYAVKACAARSVASGQTVTKNVVELLLQSGLNINALDFAGNTVLHHLLIESHEAPSEIIEYLIACGADVNATNKNGITPLHLAVMGEKWNSLGVLVTAYEIQLTPVTLCNIIPLDYAVCPGCEDRLKTMRLELNKVDVFSNFLEWPQPQELFDCSDSGNQYKVRKVEPWFEIFSRCELFKRKLKRFNHVPKCKYEQSFLGPLEMIVKLLTANPTTTDNRGRNILHLFLHTLAAYEKHGSTCPKFQVIDMIKKLADINPDAKDLPDDFGRNPLHYAVISSSSVCSSCIDDEVVEQFVTSKSINYQDKFKRTPLHYVKYVSSDSHILEMHHYVECIDSHSSIIYEMLVKKGALYRKRDGKGFSAKQLMKMRHDHVKLLRNGEEFYRNVFQIINQRFSTAFKTQLRRTQMTVKCSEAAFSGPMGLWKEPQFYTERLRNSASDIIKLLNDFLKHLAREVGKKDSALMSKIFLVGSGYERTQIRAPREFDYNFELTEFSDICDICVSPVCPPGFVHLKKTHDKKNVDNKKFEKFFGKSNNNDDENEYLLITKLKRLFEQHIKEVLREKKFWEHQNFENYLVNEYTLYSCRPHKVCATLELVLLNTINKHPVFFTISVDIVPSIRIKTFWPSAAIPEVSEKIKSNGCHLVFQQPHIMYHWIPISISYARISFARAESKVIYRCSENIKSAYKFVKHMRMASPPQLSVSEYECSSYVRKKALLFCLASAARDKTRRRSPCSHISKRASEQGSFAHQTHIKSVLEANRGLRSLQKLKRDIKPSSEIDHANTTDRSGQELKSEIRRIYYRLKRFYDNDFVPSYFCLGQYVPLPSPTEMLRSSDVTLHTRLSAMTEKAAGAEIRRCLKFATNLSEFNRTAFQRSLHPRLMANVMYLAALEDYEDLKFFISFGDINPLVENFRRNSFIQSFQ